MELCLLLSVSQSYTLDYSVDHQVPLGAKIDNFCQRLWLNCGKYKKIKFGNPYFAADLTGHITVKRTINLAVHRAIFNNYRLNSTIFLISGDSLDTINVSFKITNDEFPSFCQHCLVVETRHVLKGMAIYIPRDFSWKTKYEIFGSDLFRLTIAWTHIVLHSMGKSAGNVRMRLVAFDSQFPSRMASIDITVKIGAKYKAIEKFYFLNVPFPPKNLLPILDDHSHMLYSRVKHYLDSSNTSKLKFPANFLVKVNSNDQNDIYFAAKLLKPKDPLKLELPKGPNFFVNSGNKSFGLLRVSGDAKCESNSRAVEIVPKGHHSFTLKVNQSRLGYFTRVNITCVRSEVGCADWVNLGGGKSVIEAYIVRNESKNMKLKVFEKISLQNAAKIGKIQDFKRILVSSILPTSHIKMPSFETTFPDFDVFSENIYAPIFTNKSCYQIIKAGTPQGVELFTVEARDSDNFDMGNVYYELALVGSLNEESPRNSTDFEKFFRVHEDWGIVSAGKERLKTDYYVITVRASDRGQETLYTDLRCAVKVVEFVMFDYHFGGKSVKDGDNLTPELFEIGAIFYNKAETFLEEIPDLLYSQVNGSDPHFHVDELTGTVEILKTIPRGHRMVVKAGSRMYPTISYTFCVKFSREIVALSREGSPMKKVKYGKKIWID